MRHLEPAARLPGLDRARGHRGSRRAAAALVAAGMVCKLPAFAGPRARRVHTWLGRGKGTPREVNRPGLESARNFYEPSLTRPLQLLPASGLASRERRDSGQGRSANSPPSPAERSANAKRPSHLGAVYKLSNPVLEDFYQLYYSSAQREKQAREFDSGHK